MTIGHRNHRLLAQEASSLRYRKFFAIVAALAVFAQVAHAADSSSSASNESRCGAADHLVQQFTKLRMAAVAAVVSWRVSKLFKTTRASNPFYRLWKAGWCFADHEGLGMLLYFCISFALDSATIFLVPSAGSYCEAEKLAALYTAALVTFLPNAVYSLYLQETYWENGRTCARIGFVAGAIVLTSISFCLRLKFVFDAGFIFFVQQTMSGLSVTVRAALASSIPPMVDVIQSVILIGVTHMKRGSPATSSHYDDDSYYCDLLEDDRFQTYPLNWLSPWRPHWLRRCFFVDTANPAVRNLINASHREQVENMAERTHPDRVPMTVVAGEGVIWARRSNLLLWLTWLVVPFISLMVIPEPQEGHYAAVPWWLWALYPVILVVLLIMENKCLGYVIATQVGVTLEFKVGPFNFSKFPFWVWRWTMLGLSAASKSSIFTNSIFLARAWRTSWSAGNGRVKLVWSETMGQSVPGKLLGPCFISIFEFQYLVSVLWLCMSMQIIYALLLTTPIGPKVESHSSSFCERVRKAMVAGASTNLGLGMGRALNVDYKLVGSMDEARNSCYEYETPLDVHQNHGTALMTLADAGRMVSVTFQDSAYAKKKFRINLSRQTVADYKFRCLHLAHHQLAHSLGSFAFVAVMETVVQLNLQVSLSGILAAASHSCFDHMTMLSIGLNTVVLLLKLSNAVATRQWYLDVERHIKPNAKLYSEGGAEANLISEIRLFWKIFKWFVCLYILGFIYAIAKVVGFYKCPSHMWNLSGCVLLDSSFHSAGH